MSYAFVQDVAATWEQYQPVEGALPDGLIIHVAGRTDEGYRVIEVWEDRAAWERFQDERLAPPAATADVPGSPRPTFRDLRPEHIVLGSAHAVLPPGDGGRTSQTSEMFNPCPAGQSRRATEREDEQ